MRLLHCIASVNPCGGGPVEALKQRAEVLVRHGHGVEVASLDHPQDEWVRRFPLPCHALGPGLSNYRYSAAWLPWLQSHRHEFDVVVIDGLWQYHAFGSWRALADTDTPYLVYPHGMLDPWFKRNYPLKHLKKWMYWPWADYRVLRDARAVLFTCEQERRLARQSFGWYRCVERVVQFGAGAPRGNAETLRKAFHLRFPQLKGHRCLLYLGRMHPKKGPDLLLRAFAATLREQALSLRERVPHLVMAGPAEADYQMELLALAKQLEISDHVTWTGMLVGDLKWGAFHACEAFVLPSHQENFGVAVAEALACAKPVLISNQVNIWPEIESDGAGWVDDDTLAGTSRLLARWQRASRSELDRMAERARDCYLRRYTMDRAALSLVETLQDLGVHSTPLRSKVG